MNMKLNFIDLERQIAENKQAISSLSDEGQKLEDALWELKILPRAKKLIGKCFKYRNSGGKHDEPWDLFLRIEGVCDREFIVTKIEFLPDGSLELHVRDYLWLHDGAISKNYIPIAPSLFRKHLANARKYIQ